MKNSFRKVFIIVFITHFIMNTWTNAGGKAKVLVDIQINNVECLQGDIIFFLHKNTLLLQNPFFS